MSLQSLLNRLLGKAPESNDLEITGKIPVAKPDLAWMDKPVAKTEAEAPAENDPPAGTPLP